MRTNRTRWLAVTLICSLVGNLLLVGFIAGDFWHGKRRGAMPDPVQAFVPSLGGLSAQRRTELRPELNQRFRNLRGSLRQLRDAQRAVMEAARQQPFDQAGIDAALRDFRSQLMATQEDSHRDFVEFLSILTPEERARVLHFLHKRRHFREHRNRRPPKAISRQPQRSD